MPSGSYVALITPMTIEGSIDYPALARLLAWHVASGTSGLVLLGSTGEGTTLMPKERAALIAFAVKEVGGRCPIIVGTGSASTHQTLEMTHEAFQLGADACMVVTPYYVRPCREGLRQHYAALAKASDGPIWLYHQPYRTGADFPPSLVAELMDQHPSFVAFKDGTGDLSYMDALAPIMPKRSAMLSGDDGSVCDYLKKGGHGIVTTIGNIMPKTMQALCQAMAEGNAQEASLCHQRMQIFITALAQRNNPAAIKSMMSSLGLCQSHLRLPLVEPTDADVLKVLMENFEGE